MRFLAALVSSVLLVTAASAGARSPAAQLPAPPQCSSADNSKHAWLHVPTPGLPGGHPLYVRFCGPARAVVRVRGKTFDIRGGSCDDTSGYETIGIGLHAFARAPTASYVAYASSTAPAVFVQLPGIRSAMGQALTTGNPIRSGTFLGHFRDGTPFSGSWTCN
jgi:hypothetical protein